MYFMEMGPFIPPFAILKTESREVLIEYVWYVSKGQKHAHLLFTQNVNNMT